jgi:hypothetical protein
MRGRKSFNIRNVEAHLTSLQNNFRPPIQQTFTDPSQFSRNLVFQNTATNVIQPSEQQRQNEYINAKFGVSKYASNLVSGKMFKHV